MPYGSTTASVVSSFQVECLSSTGWRRVIRCLILIGHFLQKSSIINGSFAKNDLQLKASYPMSFCHPLRECVIWTQSGSVFLRRAMSFECALSRRSFFAKEPLIIGLFCRKCVWKTLFFEERVFWVCSKTRVFSQRGVSFFEKQCLPSKSSVFWVRTKRSVFLRKAVSSLEKQCLLSSRKEECLFSKRTVFWVLKK